MGAMRPFLSHAVRLVFLPVVVLLLGFAPGPWYCADGSPCAATAAACCCGCAEAGGTEIHVCEDAAPGEALSPETCGCYRLAVAPECVPAGDRERPDVEPGLPAPVAVIVPPLLVASPRATPASAHSPPTHLISSGDPRGPPPIG